MAEPAVATVAETQQATTFDAFFRAEYPRLARALYLLTGDRTEAEDLAQEAMARVYERWDRVRAMASPTGYVYRTATNLNRKRIRRLAVRARKAFGPSAVEDPAKMAEDRSEVLRFLASLPAGQREALVLVEWLGLDAEDAGHVLGIEAVSVRGRLHRARTALRDRFGGAGE